VKAAVELRERSKELELRVRSVNNLICDLRQMHLEATKKIEAELIALEAEIHDHLRSANPVMVKGVR